MDYISREAVLKLAYFTGEKPTQTNPYGDMREVVDVADIEALPAADVREVKRGVWEKSEDDYCGLNIIKCSLCREEWCFEVDDDVFDLNYRYCPNCGAMMIEKKEEIK